MKKFVSVLIFALSIHVGFNFIVPNLSVVVANDVDKILKAKEIVRSMVNYPDTLVFHEFSTVVKGNVVTLKFTCKNGFGVPQTYIKDITVVD